MVRALAPHRCGSGWILGLDAICGLSLLLVLFSTQRRFSPGTPVSPFPQKQTFPNSNSIQEPVSRKCRKLFGPEKLIVSVRPAFSVKLFFWYVVQGIKIKTTLKLPASRGLRLEDTEWIVSPEMRPKSFGTFEKGAPDFSGRIATLWRCHGKFLFLILHFG